MRINKTTITKANGEIESTIEIDTEAAPYNLSAAVIDDQHGGTETVIKEPRVPTAQEYEIIRDLLDLPHPDEVLTDAQISQVRTLPNEDSSGPIPLYENPHNHVPMQSQEPYVRTSSGRGIQFFCLWLHCPGLDAKHNPTLHGFRPVSDVPVAV